MIHKQAFSINFPHFLLRLRSLNSHFNGEIRKNEGESVHFGEKNDCKKNTEHTVPY